MTFRLRHRLAGGHVHCRLFTAATGPDRAFVKAGDLVFSVEEWPTVYAAFARSIFELVPEDDAIHVGDVVRVGQPCLANGPGVRAVVVEVYELERRPGWTLMFENGESDGFSPSDLALFEVTHIGRCDHLTDYQFKNWNALYTDWRSGHFAAVWT